MDESGNQLAVFGRRGARPFTQSEMYRMYLRGEKIWTVSDAPPGPPQDFAPPAAAAESGGGGAVVGAAPLR